MIVYAGGRLGIFAPGQRIHQRTSSRITADRVMPMAAASSPNLIHGSSSICVERGGVVRRLRGTRATVSTTVLPPQSDAPARGPDVTWNKTSISAPVSVRVTRNTQEGSTSPRRILADETGGSDNETRTDVAVTHMIALPTASHQSTDVRFPAELPYRAFHPDVTRVFDFAPDATPCAECAEGDVHDATMLVTYRYLGREARVGVCDAFCLDSFLQWLLGSTAASSANIVLHLGQEHAPLPADVSDLAALGLPCDQATSDHRPCTVTAGYVIAWSGRSGEARRELACRGCLGGAVDYAWTVSDGFGPPTVSPLFVTGTEVAA